MTMDERLNAIIDANKFHLYDENVALREALAAVRDLAYRAGPGDAARDALGAIHVRASRALNTAVTR